MKIEVRGTKPAKCQAARKYWGCSYCKSVFYIEDSDCGSVKFQNDQRDGEWITMVCPICEVERSMDQATASRIINERARSHGNQWDR